MKTLAISTLTICGIEELPGNSAREVTHVLSVLDPDRAEIAAFDAYGEHHRVTLRFHDIIEPRPGQIMPAPEHVEAILNFGEGLRATAASRLKGHLLVHCHMGISRSTAAMRPPATAMSIPTRPSGSDAFLMIRSNAMETPAR